MSKKATTVNSTTTKSYAPLAIAPARVLRGENCLANSGREIASLGVRPLVVGGKQTLTVVKPVLEPVLEAEKLDFQSANYTPDCAESSLVRLKEVARQHHSRLNYWSWRW